MPRALSMLRLAGFEDATYYNLSMCLRQDRQPEERIDSRESETKDHPGGRRAGRCVVYAVPIIDNLPYNITLGAC